MPDMNAALFWAIVIPAFFFALFAAERIVLWNREEQEKRWKERMRRYLR